MTGAFDNLKIISSFRRPSLKKRRIVNRETAAFIIRVKGSADYFFEDATLRVNEGEMIYIPKGSSYECILTDCGESLYMSINFNADNAKSEPKTYPLADFHNVKYITQSFSELWNFGSQSEKYKCISLFYELLSYVTKLEHLSDGEKRKSETIAPAVEYLKKHVYDCDFKINSLYKLCGISDTYFRRLFSQRFNMTPSDYVSACRLSYAKAIIESGDYGCIREVAEHVGFNDPLYFSKAFKSFFGYPPSAVNE